MILQQWWNVKIWIIKVGIFNLDRIEQNQLLSYKRYRECDNINFILAIKWNNSVWFIDFGLLEFYHKSIDLKLIEPTIKNWKEEVDNEISNNN